MKTLSKKNNWTILIGIILAGCVSSHPKFFSSVETTDDPSYGYSAENPVPIKNGNLENSINASYYYLSRLRTQNGSKLEVLQRFSIENPNYDEPAIPLKNRFTGEPLSYGTGPLLDLYVVVPENSNDTLQLYINPYLKGDVKAPAGLNFQKNVE